MFRRCPRLNGSSVSRGRTERKVVAPDVFEEFGSGKLKISKIPTGFVNFDSIHLLPPRELAYTAHLALRLGLDSERLWNQVRESFIECGMHMKPKYFAQCAVALCSRSDRVERVISMVSARSGELRLVDILMILHALPAKSVSADTGATLLKNVSPTDLSSLPPKALAFFTGDLGKHKLCLSGPLLEALLVRIEENKFRFTAFEIAAIVRTMGFFPPKVSHAGNDGITRVVPQLLLAADWTQIDAGSLSIIMDALCKLESSGVNVVNHELLRRITSQFSATLLQPASDPNLLPHMLYGVARLAIGGESPDAVGLCLRVSRTILRKKSDFKPVSLWLVVESLRHIHSKPDLASSRAREDARVLLNEAKGISSRATDEWLARSTEEERASMIESKYCQISNDLKLQLHAYIDERRPGNLEFSGRDNGTGGVERDGGGVTGEDAMKKLWLLQKSKSPVSAEEVADLVRVVESAAITAPQSDVFYSLFFRSVLTDKSQPRSILPETIRGALGLFLQASEMSFKTMCRALEVSLKFDHLSQATVVDALCWGIASRIEECDSADLVGVLRLFAKAGKRFDQLESPLVVFADAFEAKIALELNQIKSQVKREFLTNRLAKQVGLESAADVMDEYEEILASEWNKQVIH